MTLTSTTALRRLSRVEPPDGPGLRSSTTSVNQRTPTTYSRFAVLGGGDVEICERVKRATRSRFLAMHLDTPVAVPALTLVATAAEFYPHLFVTDHNQTWQGDVTLQL